MKKMNYRTTVTTTEDTLKIAFIGELPRELPKTKIRLQAVFSSGDVDRRLPMEVTCDYEKNLTRLIGILSVELPYVFFRNPTKEVFLTFSLWYGPQEYVLNAEPYKIDADKLYREEAKQVKDDVAFAGYSVALPFMLSKYYFKEGRDMEKAKHEVNKKIYEKTGRGYSPRQGNTDYFAEYYDLIAQEDMEPETEDGEVTTDGPLAGQKTVMFLSERKPEAAGNLMLMKKMFEQDPDIYVTEFINTKTVDQLSKQELRECAEKCAKAHVIILEDFYPQLHKLHIRKETKIVQLWHACGAFKTFGYSRMGLPGGVDQHSMNHRNYDLCCVSSEALRGIYAEAFGIPTKNVQALGVPRTDMLFNWDYRDDKEDELLDKYPALENALIVMFAPTFRGDGNKDAYYPMDKFDINAFMEAMPEDVVLIIKHHPFVKEQIHFNEKWRGRVLDLSEDENINNLLMITDLLITDYSSCIFEAALMDVPTIHYAFDEEEYMASRDFYFSFDKIAAGPIIRDFGKLVQKVQEFAKEDDETEFMSDIYAEQYRSPK